MLGGFDLGGGVDVRHGRWLGRGEVRGRGGYGPEGIDGQRFIYHCGVVRICGRDQVRSALSFAG